MASSFATRIRILAQGKPAIADFGRGRIIDKSAALNAIGFQEMLQNQLIVNDSGLLIDCNHASNIQPPHAHVATLTSMQKCGIVQNPLVFKAIPCPGRVRRRAFYTNPDAVGKRHCTILLPSTFSNNVINANVF